MTMTQAALQPRTIAGMTGRAAIIAVVLVAVAAALPVLLTNYEVGLATEMLIFGILAMSIDILAGFAGRTPLGHGAIFGVSSYVVVYATAQAGLPPMAAFVLGVAAATLVAAIFALLAVRTSGVYFLLLTLALGMIVWGICLRWTQVTGGENGMRGDVRPASLVTHSAFYWAVLGAAAVVSYAMWRFVRSPFGLTLRGIRDSESRMRSLGYNVPLHLFVGFTASGFFAGAAGALYALFNSFVSPSTVALAQSVPDAERAVEPSALRHGVGVGPDQHCLGGGGVASQHIADPVHGGIEAGVAQLFDQPAPRRDVRFGERHPIDAGLKRPDAGEFAQVGHQPGAVDTSH